MTNIKTYKCIICGDSDVEKIKIIMDLKNNSKVSEYDSTNIPVYSMVFTTSLATQQHKFKMIIQESDVIELCDCVLIIFNQFNLERILFWYKKVKAVSNDIDIIICNNNKTSEPWLTNHLNELKFLKPDIPKPHFMEVLSNNPESLSRPFISFDSNFRYKDPPVIKGKFTYTMDDYKKSYKNISFEERFKKY